ncbi:MAG: transcriptional regulator [Oscillospiraceae bacterium]|nr:transcriptional regulator [Oscillospiraceae bacterium]
MENKLFYNVEDIMKIFGVEKSSAYRLIKKLNEELAEKGYYTLSGVVNAKYFRERAYI